MNRGLTDRGALVLLAFLVAVLFADVLFLGSTFYARDLTRFYMPADMILRHAVRSGELPLWNRFWAAGQPFAADPVFHVFYPGRILLFLAPFAFAFKLHLVIHYFIAGSGMYVLLRSMKARPAAALFAATTYAFGGHLASLSNLLTLLYSAALLPWIAVATRRALLTQRLSHAAVAVFPLAALLLLGEQSMIFEAGTLIGMYAIWRGWRESRISGAARQCARAAAIIVAAVAIAAVQLIPALDFSRDIPRAHGVPYSMATLWSMHPLRPLELVFPENSSATSPSRPHCSGEGAPSPVSQLRMFTASTPACSRRRSCSPVSCGGSADETYAAVLAAASFLVAVGGNGPVFEVLYAAGFRIIRYPGRSSSPWQRSSWRCLPDWPPIA